jgi:FkbM family methyltransferase
MARVTNGFSNSVFLQKILFNALRLYRPEIKPMLQNRDVGFLAYCLSRRARSRSQILQDLWVCFELEEKQDGFFVEFGATNGVKNSNTWLLEKELGWRGILAEPNPFWHSDLAANRHVQIEHQCVSRRSGDSVSFITTDDTDPELSAIAADTAMNDHFADLRRKAKSITLTTISLDDLLDRYDAPAVIDYISIDTEGNEFEILSSFDFDRRRFKLISVEQNKDTEHKIQKLLESKHYIRVFTQFSQWDGWYISAEMRQSSRTIFAPDA